MPHTPRFLSRPGMPTPAQLLHWIARLGIKATASACNINERTLQRWFDAQPVAGRP